MGTEKTRLNITIPKDLLATLDHIAGSRKRSRFIVDAVYEKIEQEKKRQLEKDLEACYRARRRESLEMASDRDRN